MSKIDPNKTLPQIHQRRTVAKSGLFTVEQIDLEFSNGELRTFERMAGGGRGAVMIVPFINDHEFLLVREYAAGTHSYQLGFPKGLIDPGEEPAQAADRELKEEVGFGATTLHYLQNVSMAPAFFNARMDIFIAENLYEQTLPGDEPEPLDVIKWSINDLDALLARDDFVEARCITALFLAQKWLKEQ
ncbi:ADP compounds hydrolase NudE [Paraglaciecola chathamensis]|jgi:ADP-ribose diphosphatase|uniref:ADP compounds hydrolase NudE n=3 Tax=Paraglaciecola chathamensis TaxID=368405 RepID=A0A8H9M5H7_9ALTE|nr:MULTISPECIES: ADP compounds hydrolase NudE [Paraglaciecola]AEE25093.1 NUDIX hydrolase [Glaciecola sp. 4H-3-7+YE-5]MBN27540.1 ADP compounds hydrolase NudE [Alteromonadaceae bacterium]MBU3017772.1 ADP compounds hydrolase NudE [Paraglaciecola agarilytica]MDO6560168.1 ADP compounds hydrolase NudE [Paraglaciecola chathamensis]GAC05142.1 ADP-ribose diphosphatase [Paraglaciecola agarilytica NO2]|tara:strand:+ start:4324 stop:4887 length:564 start_codon:yes stop_codon:yes gene_type:complete